MMLVKRAYLYVLVTLVFILLVSGEVRYFLALKSVNLVHTLELKYELENFIFAFIILTIIVYSFLIYFMRASTNVYKRLDRMIELSEYGKQDISEHLKRLGRLGEKIGYLLHHFRELNDMKSLKISSLSGISGLLVEKNSMPLFLLNRHGNVVDCSDRLLHIMKIDRDMIVKQNASELFKNMDYEELFFDLERARTFIMKKNAEIEVNNKKIKRDVNFYPILNAEDQISHIIGIFESKGS